MLPPPHGGSGLRAQIGQASWITRRFASPRRIVDLRRALRGLHLPVAEVEKSAAGQVWGVMLARNELDVLPAVVAHTLSQDVDRLLIVDHGSTDGTLEWLRDHATHEPRLLVGTDDEPRHIQAEKTTVLAHWAWRHGADWVVPIDADEFWFADGGRTLGQCLRDSSLGIAHAQWHQMLPADGQPPLGSGTIPADYTFWLDPGPDSIGKVAARTHPLLEIHTGNHSATRVGAQGAPGLHVAHALYRSRDQVARKFRQGAAALAGASTLIKSVNSRWLNAARLTDEDFDQVWANLQRGLPEPRIEFTTSREMVRAQPLLWRSWDPDGALAVCDHTR